MPRNPFALTAVLAANLLIAAPTLAQYSTPPASSADLEAIYTTAIENRTAAILKLLDLKDSAKAARVHDTIIAQYRALRARDVIIDGKLKAQGKEINYANREGMLAVESKPLHEKFLAKLSADLTPQQIEIVKDQMTYHKVKVTYDAYCEIVPNLTEADKAEILDELKQAREEAIDGGNAGEKSAIFQKYKNRINAYLDTHGHDVAKAYRDWNAKQAAANKEDSASAGNAAPPAH